MFTSRSLKLHKNNATSTIQSFDLKKCIENCSCAEHIYINIPYIYIVYNQCNKVVKIIFTTQSSTQKWTEKKQFVNNDFFVQFRAKYTKGIIIHE